jgi:hypothetical protein
LPREAADVCHKSQWLGLGGGICEIAIGPLHDTQARKVITG